jgi:DGQHR domain-containing protein
MQESISPDLNFSVIDGQHRINGAFLAVNILRKKQPHAIWEIPAEIFIDLDKKGDAPRRQAQIFIDVNFYQKKVDRSLVADLFPTARGDRGPLDNKERAQDLGRKLMLEVGPLVGMIQIPGIRFGVKDVVTLATLAAAVEDILDDVSGVGIKSLEAQAEFIAQCLTAWLQATGRKEELVSGAALDPGNVAYQGRVIVSFLTLLPACIWKLRRLGKPLVAEASERVLTTWLRDVMNRAGLLDRGKFLPKTKFREKGFLGSGGLARFRDTLWAAALSTGPISRLSPETLETIAIRHREKVDRELRR